MARGGGIFPDADAYVHTEEFQDIHCEEKPFRKIRKKPFTRTKVSKLLFYINEKKE